MAQHQVSIYVVTHVKHPQNPSYHPTDPVKSNIKYSMVLFNVYQASWYGTGQRRHTDIMCKFQKLFDTNGVLYHIATKRWDLSLQEHPQRGLWFQYQVSEMVLNPTLCKMLSR